MARQRPARFWISSWLPSWFGAIVETLCDPFNSDQYRTALHRTLERRPQSVWTVSSFPPSTSVLLWQTPATSSLKCVPRLRKLRSTLGDSLVNNHDLPPSVPNAHRRTTEIPWKLLFRIVRWSTYAGSVITLVLVLHKSPPPDVHVTAQAAAHVDEKLEQVQQAAASGQPAALHIDETELNSYLATHFALSGNVSRLQNAPGTASPAPDAGTRDSLSPTSRGAENADAAQDSSAPTADDVE